MAKFNTIPIELLRQLISYDERSGMLVWVERPREMFATQRAFRTWNARLAGKPALASPDATGYLYGSIFCRPFKAHRVAWALATGEWPSTEIDHINGDRGDNRLSNLRPATTSENRRNVRRRDANTSGVNGVSWDASRGKWMAFIGLKTGFVNLGRFDELQDAAAARRNAEVSYGFSDRHGKPL